MPQKNSLLLIVLILLIVSISIPVIVTEIEKIQANMNAELIQKDKDTPKQNNSVIIVYSRSSTTLILAQYIAEEIGASVYQLKAPAYELGLLGWSNAMIDARNHTAIISPKTIDLTPYEVIYLGSPIWLYSPAPPIWAFAKENNFTDKHVVLFNTYNSKFEQSYIDKFEALVSLRGAVSFKHQHIRRGRIGQQVAVEKMVQKFKQTYLSNSMEKY